MPWLKTYNLQEVYEPLFEDLVARSEQDGFQIKHIWIADMSVVGGSAIENQDNLGNDPSWWDLSRDLVCIGKRYTSVILADLRDSCIW